MRHFSLVRISAPTVDLAGTPLRMLESSVIDCVEDAHAASGLYAERRTISVDISRRLAEFRI